MSLTINLRLHCAALPDSFVVGLLRPLLHPPLPYPTHSSYRPPLPLLQMYEKKKAASEFAKDEEEESEGRESDGNKKSRRILGDLQHRAQGSPPTGAPCVCVESEGDTGSIQSWPCHAESYFPLAVARQRHLDRKRRWMARRNKNRKGLDGDSQRPA